MKQMIVDVISTFELATHRSDRFSSVVLCQVLHVSVVFLWINGKRASIHLLQESHCSGEADEEVSRFMPHFVWMPKIMNV